jgi:hypothetical protein
VAALWRPWLIARRTGAAADGLDIVACSSPVLLVAALYRFKTDIDTVTCGLAG